MQISYAWQVRTAVNTIMNKRTYQVIRRARNLVHLSILTTKKKNCTEKWKISETKSLMVRIKKHTHTHKSAYRLKNVTPSKLIKMAFRCTCITIAQTD